MKPIFPTGELNQQGNQDDAYATRDYFSVNQQFGSATEFDSLVGEIHREGLKIVIDLAAGYAAWDSQVLLEHPEWFVHNDEGNIVSPEVALPDVAKLNYDHHELRKYMIAVMEHWIRDVGVDGFRCKAAEKVPLEFWNIARNELEKIKPIVLISDGSSPASHGKAFDLTLSRSASTIFDKIEQDSLPAKRLTEILQAENNYYPQGSLFLRCGTECTEESARASKIGDLMVAEAVSMFTLPGVPLLCASRHGSAPKRSGISEMEMGSFGKSAKQARLYQQLALFRSLHSALREGRIEWLANTDSAAICSFARIGSVDTVLVFLNLSGKSKKISTIVPIGASSLWREYFTGTVIQCEGDELPITLAPFDCALLYPLTGGNIS